MLWRKKGESASPITASFDIARMSYLELKELRDKVDAELAKQYDQARSAFQHDFLVKMQEFGLTIDDLKPKRRKRSVKIKYRNPDNPEQTWSGLGQPKPWLQEKLDQGRQLDEFLIQ